MSRSLPPMPASVLFLLLAAPSAAEFGVLDASRYKFLASTASVTVTARSWNLSPTAQEFMAAQSWDPSRFQASFPSLEAVPDDYHEMTDTWRVKGDVETVFRRFMRAEPSAWSGGSAVFEFLWDPATAAGYDRDAGAFPAISEGQVVLLTLDLLPKLKLSTVFQFVEVDAAARRVSFSYLASNPGATGVQRATFSQDGEEVVVTHVSRYKSASWFRDVVFYPPVHRALLDGFYGRVLAAD